MKNVQVRPLTALALFLLPLAAQAALTPVGSPLPIADESPCSSLTELEVTATPKGAFEVVWVDGWEEIVKGRRYDRGLNPTPAVGLLPMHGGLTPFDFLGTFAAGRYEVAMNVADFGTDPSDPLAAYRASLDLDGEPVAPLLRVETQRFLELAPAAGGDSLQFRSEPPLFGPIACQNQGILVRRIDETGAPISAESRLTRRASAWTAGGYLVADRLPNDTFFAAYSTCERFFGVVARRMNASGVPVGKPFNLPLPGRVGNYGGGNLSLAARSNTDLAVAAMVSATNSADSGGYTAAVVNGKVFGPTRIPIPSSVAGIAGVVDLEASPDGGYLLLFLGASGNPQRLALFAQELDEQGVPQGEAVQITGDDEFGVNGAVDPLPDGRWIVVTRAQHTEAEVCTERLIGTVLSSD